VFVRKKPNKSGSISIQIIDKTHGYRVVKSFGSSHDPDEIEKFFQQGKRWISQTNKNQLKLFPLQTKEETIIKGFLEEISNSQIRTIGPELIFGELFDRIGFNQIKDELFRHLVISRLAYPGSKLKTVDYLKRYQGIDISVDKLYRFLDKLHNRHKKQAEQIAFSYTKKVLDNHLSVVFYDLTTLYFESQDEDDLRKTGYSKDGKFNKPQIVLALLVGIEGYPIGYEMFPGNTFEGHTLIPTIKKFQKRFKLKKPVIVADAALLNKNNIDELKHKHYQYILGARIKNETKIVKQQILNHNYSTQATLIIKKDKRTKLIINYSEKRARKDKHNRKRGLTRLEKQLKKGKLTKDKINNRGYNKYLKLKGKIEVKIDYDKFEKDVSWDGLKGYLTNADLQEKTIINNYKQLWHIEKAFRISKTDLKIRPIHLRIKKRIEAHICIAFSAYTIYKELERILYQHKSPFSARRAADLTQTMYALHNPKSDKSNQQIILKMDREQKLIYDMLHS
jgi:transposase